MLKHLSLVILLLLATCRVWASGEVVVYTSVDQVYSEPVLRLFEQQTGIRVKPVYDVEASKTTGLVNRLIAEKAYPRADVFWNSEIARTLLLKERDVLAPYHSPTAHDIPDRFRDKAGYWAGFAIRARVLIYNTKLLQPSELPQSIFDLTQPRWKGKVVMGYPLFGTTATHVAAWYALLGAEKTERYLTELKKNDVVIVDGNAVARDLVVRGEVPIGFTDTDDVRAAVQQGKAVDMVFPDRTGIGTLLIPNTVCLTKGAPHPDEGRQLIDFLLSREVERRLAFSDSMQIPVRDDVERPPHVPMLSFLKAMAVDYPAIAANVEKASRFSRALFVR